MAWTARDIPDLTGSVAVVTGASGGHGLETARALAGAGAEVVMVAKDAARTYTAAARIHETDPDASLSILPADLSSLESVATAARTLLASHEQVDIMVNNAGVMAIPWQRTVDGFEMQIGVNHLGHFALTAHLLPLLLRAPAARVVSVTSTAHHLGRAAGSGSARRNGSARGAGSAPVRYHPWRAYGRSKLANLHFALGLHRLFTTAGAPAASLLAAPGLSRAGVQEDSVPRGGGRSQRLFAFLVAHAGMAPAQAVLPQLRAATDPGARSGEFYAPLLVAGGPPVHRPVLLAGLDQAIRRLWMESERATGLRLDIEALHRAAPAAASG